MTPEEKALDLRDLAEPLARQVFAFVRGEIADKAPLMAELSRRLAIYAARGDAEGVAFVRARMAAAVQASKLEAESGFEVALDLAGRFLLDAAESFLPRLVGRLESRVLDAIGDGS